VNTCATGGNSIAEETPCTENYMPLRQYKIQVTKDLHVTANS